VQVIKRSSQKTQARRSSLKVRSYSWYELEGGGSAGIAAWQPLRRGCSTQAIWRDAAAWSRLQLCCSLWGPNAVSVAVLLQGSLGLFAHEGKVNAHWCYVALFGLAANGSQQRLWAVLRVTQLATRVTATACRNVSADILATGLELLAQRSRRLLAVQQSTRGSLLLNSCAVWPAPTLPRLS
jgi:hypothetical protein